MNKYSILNEIKVELEQYDITDHERLIILKSAKEDDELLQIEDVSYYVLKLLKTNKLSIRKIKHKQRIIDYITSGALLILVIILMVNYLNNYDITLILIGLAFLVVTVNQLLKKNYFNAVSMLFISLVVTLVSFAEELKYDILYLLGLIIIYLLTILFLKKLKTKHYRQNEDLIDIGISDFSKDENYYSNRLGGQTVSLTGSKDNKFYLDNSLGQLNIDFDDYYPTSDIEIHIINNIGEIDIKINDNYEIINNIHGTFNDISYPKEGNSVKIVLYGTNNLGKIHLYR